MKQLLVFLCLCTLLSNVVIAQDEVAGEISDESVKATEAVVEVDDVSDDIAIQNRLEGIFDQVNEFAELECEVTAGVVRLSGSVPDAASKSDALALLERTKGVVFTIDRVKIDAEVEAQLSPAVKKLKTLWAALILKLPLIIIALLTALLFISLAEFLHRRESWFERLPMSSLTRVLMRRLVRLVILVLGIVLALEILDATAIVGAILGAAGLAGLAIGFAFRNIAENYLAGILLSTRNPFEIGDAIEINGMIGKVARLSPRDTVLVTVDGNHLRIPNSVVMNSELLNYSRNPRRRFDFTVGVSVDLDLNKARAVGLDAMKQNPGVLESPKPSVTVESLGDSAVVVRFFGWLDQTESDFLKTKSEAIRLVKEAYDDAGIEMPEPIYRVHMKEVGAIAASSDSNESEVQIPTFERRPRVGSEDVMKEDLSPDRSIDDQIEEESCHSGEENLLAPGNKV